MIYIQVLDYKWSPLGYDDIELEEIIAKNFIEDVKRSINTQKYKFEPLSPRYLMYKKKNGLSLNTWEATSQLKNSLKYTIKGDTITIGWDKGLIHKKSKLKVYQVAMTLEYGNLNIPPRPLFRNVLREYSKDPMRTPKKLPQSGIFSSANKKSFLSKMGAKLKSIFKKFGKR